jgi:hypothetical protein
MWPKEKPKVPPDPHGWFSDQRAHALKALIEKHKVKSVLEVGSWLGQSTLFFASRVDHVTAVDSWLGSPNHWDREELLPKLATLYETFLVNCWDFRHKITPMRMASEVALRILTKKGAYFDLVFIDGDHTYETVKKDITLSLSLARVICGDDYPNKGVNRAVHETFHQVGVYDRIWWAK